MAYGSHDFQVEDIIDVSDNSQDDCDVQIDEMWMYQNWEHIL